jgi:hypothetical protein
MEKENWINEILNSANGMTKVTPNEDLYSRIEQKIFLKDNVVSIKTVWLVAASIVILISLNISALQNKQATTNETSEAIIASTLNKSNQLY